MYSKGDIVQYGTSGICDIADITTVDIHGIDKDRLFYVLKTRNNSGTIYAAVDGDTSKMRKLISKEEAVKLIAKVVDIEPLQIKDKKKPEAEYKETLRKYDCVELFKLIKCIYFRKKKRLNEGKKIMAVDEKYMKLAEDVLSQEVGTVLDIPKDQVLEYLIRRIEDSEPM